MAKPSGTSRTTRTKAASDGIAVITLGSAKRIYFDEEMDALTDSRPPSQVSIDVI